MKTTTFAVLLLATCAASTALAVPSYNIVPLGFDDLEHTRDDGHRESYFGGPYRFLNEAGQVIGLSITHIFVERPLLGRGA